MLQNAEDIEVVTPSRPVFLKILCILTFIGSGYGIINSVVTYFNANSIANIVAEAKTQMDSAYEKKKMNNDAESGIAKNVIKNMSLMTSPENLKKTAIGTIITSVLCLFGAILMWRLRKSGFYIYTLGTLIGIILPFYFFGNNFLTNISAGFQSFIGILFVIFYAMNLKSMK